MVLATKKTSTMTFRIDEDVLNKLREESEHRETSLNTFVNQIYYEMGGLRDLVQRDEFAALA